jgi:CHAD domain-containing protein
MLSGESEMQGKPSTDELCAFHENEDIHTEWVTSLALKLFDLAYVRAKLKASDRAVLETAGRLHDVGYRSRPDDHVHEGVRIVLEHGVDGISKAQLSYVAGIMLLHSGRYETFMKDDLFSSIGDMRRVKRLGAMLRLADALDYGHVQNAHIVDAKHVDASLTLVIKVGAFDAFLQKAEAKADLWRTAMGFDIVLQPSSTRRKGMYSGLVLNRDGTLDAARRLLFYQYRTMQLLLPGAKGRTASEHLLEIRVAIRCYRDLLKLFGGLMKKTSAPQIMANLGALNRELGTIRDIDVLSQYLESDDVVAGCAQDPAWASYCDHVLTGKHHALASLPTILEGDRFRETLLEMAKFMRIEIPAIMRKRKSKPVRKHLARNLHRIMVKLLDKQRKRKIGDPETMHKLRGSCRRARHWAEFASPVLGAETRQLASSLKTITEILGTVHDHDVALQHLGHDHSAPQSLHEVISNRRDDALKEFEGGWKTLCRKKYITRIMNTFEKAAKVD